MKLALGTAQFGLNYGIANQYGQIGVQESKVILGKALTSGINLLDTAIAYGESESCLGKLGIDEFDIVTKLPSIPDGCENVDLWIKNQVNQSLSRLGVEHVYGLLLHRPEQLLGVYGKDIYNSLKNLKASSRVKKIGISIYDPLELNELYPIFKFDLIQAPFSVFDRRLLNTGWMNRLHQEDVELHTRSLFLQGLLLMAQKDRPEKFNRWGKLWHNWHSWLDTNNISALQTCVSYTLSFPEIKKAVVGIDSLEQLVQILDAVNLESPEIPNYLSCSDLNLLNPARWTEF